MYELAKITAPNGAIEKYGASQKLTDEATANYADRGQLASLLLVATLTETPYASRVGGAQYEIPVSNVYTGQGADGGAGTDTVDEAREVLAEFLTASVPGVPKTGLGTYKTRYSTLWSELAPERRAAPYLRSAFEESFVESARAAGVSITGPKDGLRIIDGAPRAVRALRLEDRDPGYLSRSDQILNAVTEEGHIIQVHSYERFGGKVLHYLGYDVSDLKNGYRGGRAPRSTIISDITRRVVSLRTCSSKR